MRTVDMFFGFSENGLMGAVCRIYIEHHRGAVRRKEMSNPERFPTL